MNETLEAIRTEWLNGGLARCLAGEEAPAYPLPSNRIVGWREPEIRLRWTAEEDAIIREHYLAEGYKGLLDLLPRRSKDEIKSRARALGMQAKRCGSRVKRQA